MGQRAGVHAMPGSCAGDNTEVPHRRSGLLLPWLLVPADLQTHFRAYREAVALVQAQEAVNKAFQPIHANFTCIGDSSQPSTIGANMAPMVAPASTSLTQPDSGQDEQESSQLSIPAHFAGMAN